MSRCISALRYQGQYFDAETGLHYNRSRYYDPDAGRFISQDPQGSRAG
nr:RHS repeat-associated core domain-containing protein [Cronobacter sakazakii]